MCPTLGLGDVTFHPLQLDGAHFEGTQRILACLVPMDRREGTRSIGTQSLPAEHRGSHGAWDARGNDPPCSSSPCWSTHVHCAGTPQEGRITGDAFLVSHLNCGHNQRPRRPRDAERTQICPSPCISTSPCAATPGSSIEAPSPEGRSSCQVPGALPEERPIPSPAWIARQKDTSRCHCMKVPHGRRRTVENQMH